MNNIGVFEMQDVMNHRDAIIIDNIIWLDILDNVDDAEWVELGRIRTMAPTMLQAETRPDQRGLSHLLGEVGGCDGEYYLVIRSSNIIETSDTAADSVWRSVSWYCPSRLQFTFHFLLQKKVFLSINWY